MSVDRSEGWDDVAERFLTARSDVGAALVRSWALSNVPSAGTIVDVGCGSGVPIAEVLIEDGFSLFGIDAAPRLVEAFRHRFPNAPCICEPVQDSQFFGVSFDAAVAVGLMFLLPPSDQREAIGRIAAALKPAGHFLFSCPLETCEWDDLLTGRKSRSLGHAAYQDLLRNTGLQLVGCEIDEGQNNYYHAVKQLA